MSYPELPLLYSFRRCPYAIRARLALYYAKVVFDTREVDLKEKPAAMLQASPKGTVPVMVFADGQVMDESWDVMRWAMVQNNDEGFLDESVRKETSSLVETNDFVFKSKLDRYKYADRHPENSIEFYRDESLFYLNQLEGLLSKNTFLLSNRAGLVDLAIFPFIRQFSFVDKSWFDQSSYPKLQDWLRFWLNSTAFKVVMEKRKPLE